jgi:hypothetical protein
VPIDTEAAAQRLARAMLTDIAYYNRAKLSAGADPRVAFAADLAEARDLFHQRVTPALHALFEREVLAFDFSDSAAPASRRVSAGVVVVLVVVLAGSAYMLLSR